MALSHHRSRHELTPHLATINAALTTEPLRFLLCGPIWRRMRNVHILGGFRTPLPFRRCVELEVLVHPHETRRERVEPVGVSCVERAELALLIREIGQTVGIVPEPDLSIRGVARSATPRETCHGLTTW